MSNKIEHDFSALNGLSSGENSNSLTIPIQALPVSKKKLPWKKATVDALERNGLRQIHKNIKFRSYRKMIAGEFTYSGTGVSDNEDFDLPWFNDKVRSLREKQHIPTYIKHFDFIGIIVNALSGIYTQLDDKFRVESIDEYSTNEYIRQKTEMLHTFAQQTFIAEVNQMLLQRGIDVNKSDFQSQEEADAYKQEIQNQTKALTPPEIEKFMSKNFKVLATEWAQNVLTADRKRFYLADLEREEFVNYLLSGRYFRHFRVGYDAYYIEPWRPEETFFSQDVNAKYPQDGEYCGRITSMSISDILNRFGHIMTFDEQSAIGNYWNQSKNYAELNGAQLNGGKASMFPTPTTVPFHNFYDHQVNTQLEDAMGVPLGLTTSMDANGNPTFTNTFLPRMESETDLNSNLHTQFLRDDIEVRKDTIRVAEMYWVSQKQMAIVIYENKFGSMSVELVTEDILDDFIEDNEIKTAKKVSLQELQQALKDDNLAEYVNTITYFYCPEVWKAVKIKGNGSTVKKDLYLDVRPLDYQIKGDSNLYDVKLPVTGIIGVGIASKIAPYQQLHNICMNQITELLEKELGVFFTFDITGLPSEYQDENTTETLLRVRDDIKDTGLFGLDLSRQNTQGNSPNIFQRQEIVYATQVQYRWQLAQQYKQEALSQIGLTPQILGQPSTYETAEGVKQGAQASYALINHLFDDMNTSKAKGMEVHLAIAQYCEVNGKDTTTLLRKSDGDHAFLNILAEDGELFLLRKLGVVPETNSNDRKIVQDIKQFVLNDNTLDRRMDTVIEMLTNPVLSEIKEIAVQAERRTEAKTQEDRAFQQSQLKQQLDANAQETEKERQQEVKITQMNNETRLEEAKIQYYGKLGDKQVTDVELYNRLDEATQQAIDNNYKATDIALKQSEIGRKENSDVERTKSELRKLALQAEKLKLEKEKIASNERIALYNKN